jgi:hypothetical protein
MLISYKIECFKVLIKTQDGMFSPYQNYKYEFDKEYKDFEDKSVMRLGEHTVVDKGFFHVYKKVNECNSLCNLILNKKWTPIIVKCIIPENTSVYFDETGQEICGDRIIIKEILND